VGRNTGWKNPRNSAGEKVAALGGVPTSPGGEGPIVTSKKEKKNWGFGKGGKPEKRGWGEILGKDHILAMWRKKKLSTGGDYHRGGEEKMRGRERAIWS